MLAVSLNALFRPGKIHSYVFLSIDSLIGHDNLRLRNQNLKSKVDWCLETDHNSISICCKPDAFYRAGKMQFPVGFAESKALCDIY